MRPSNSNRRMRTSAAFFAACVIGALLSSTVSEAKQVNVLPCIISPWAPFHFHGDFVTYGYPKLAAKYWPDLNVSRMVTVGSYNDYSAFDVVRSYMKGEGGTKCDLVIGPGYSDGCIAISPLIGKPLWIDFASTSTQLTSKAMFPNFLRVVSTDAVGGVVVAHMLATFDWKNIFLIKSDDSYGATYTTGVTTEHTRNGGQVARTFNLLKEGWSVDLFKSILLEIRGQMTVSRVVVVIGVDADIFADAVIGLRSQGIYIDTELTFVFSDYACSANYRWTDIKNAFCVAVDLDSARFADFTQRYTSRSDKVFNESRVSLEEAGYPTEELDSQRNELGSYTALSVDAMFYGLAVLQRYQAAHNGTLPDDSVAAATWAIGSGISFPEGLSGPLGVDTNGDRAEVISAVISSGVNGVAVHVGRDNGGTFEFSEAVYVGGKAYDLRGLSPSQIATTLPADRMPIPPPAKTTPAYVWIIVALGVAVVLLLVGGVVFAALRRKWRAEITQHAPKSETEPVTLIFTDIESSTALWAECPQQMVTALELHNTIIRQCIAAHRGYEVKTIGDSFMIAFCSPLDAVNCSLAIQVALHAADWSNSGDGTKISSVNNFYEEVHADDADESPSSVWNGLRVRIGGHYGFVSIRRTVTTNPDGKPSAIDEATPYDYFGSTVNVAARIEAIGHGGQILFSKALVDACDDGGNSMNGLSVLSSMDTVLTNNGTVPFFRNALGPVSLRGYNEPVMVVQLCTKEFAARAFGPLRLEKADDVAAARGGEEADNDKDASSGHSVMSRASGNLTAIGTSNVDVATAVLTFAQKRRLAEGDIKYGYAALDALTSIMDASQQKKFFHDMAALWRLDRQEIMNDGKPVGNRSGFVKLQLAARFGPIAATRESKLFGMGRTRRSMLMQHSSYHGSVAGEKPAAPLAVANTAGGVFLMPAATQHGGSNDDYTVDTYMELPVLTPTPK